MKTKYTWLFSLLWSQIAVAKTTLLLKILQFILAADVRPVVLCKDCVYLTHDEYGAWCFNNYEANLKDDDFCSHGKRKEKQT